MFVRPPGPAQRGNDVTAHGLTGAAVIAQTGSYGSAIVTGTLALYAGIILVAVLGSGNF